MATPTDTTAGDLPSPNPLERLREAFGRLTNQQKILLMVAIAAAVALIVGAVLWNRQPEYRVLFSDLSEKDGGAVIAALEQQNIPYRMSSTGAITVPAERVHDLRMRLASQGLPRGGSVGFEILDNIKFGTSQKIEEVAYQRGLEGELARTIQTIGAVQSARVHLAIPKPSVFVREEQKPTASVLLNLYPGRILEPSQIGGITHLVSSSIPGLTYDNVNIVDQNGSLLPSRKNQLTDSGLDPAQIKYVREIEEGIIKRIEEILKPVFGTDNYKVQVAADIDFSHTEQTAESYRPNSAPNSSSIRSQQNAEAANVNQQQPTGGIPGALTNQPPVPATAPLTVPPPGAAQGQAATPGEGTGKVDVAGISAPISTTGQPLSTSKNATINYEVDKTVRYTKQALGNIRRLSAAVVVNYRKETGKDGKPVAKALPEEEMKQIADLVRGAMGFSKERGDALSVANSPFSVPEKEEVPLWKDPENVAFAKEVLKYLLIAAIVAYILLKVVQPLMKTMFPLPAEPTEEEAEAARLAAEGEAEAEAAEEEGEEGVQVEIDHYAIKVQKARDIAQQDPRAVANIIKEWMGANG